MAPELDECTVTGGESAEDPGTELAEAPGGVSGGVSARRGFLFTLLHVYALHMQYRHIFT